MWMSITYTHRYLHAKTLVFQSSAYFYRIVRVLQQLIDRSTFLRSDEHILRSNKHLKSCICPSTQKKISIDKFIFNTICVTVIHFSYPNPFIQAQIFLLFIDLLQYHKMWNFNKINKLQQMLIYIVIEIILKRERSSKKFM